MSEASKVRSHLLLVTAPSNRFASSQTLQDLHSGNMANGVYRFVLTNEKAAN